MFKKPNSTDNVKIDRLDTFIRKPNTSQLYVSFTDVSYLIYNSWRSSIIEKYYNIYLALLCENAKTTNRKK